MLLAHSNENWFTDLFKKKKKEDKPKESKVNLSAFVSNVAVDIEKLQKEADRDWDIIDRSDSKPSEILKIYKQWVAKAGKWATYVIGVKLPYLKNEIKYAEFVNNYLQIAKSLPKTDDEIIDTLSEKSKELRISWNKMEDETGSDEHEYPKDTDWGDSSAVDKYLDVLKKLEVTAAWFKKWYSSQSKYVKGCCSDDFATDEWLDDLIKTRITKYVKKATQGLIEGVLKAHDAVLEGATRTVEKGNESMDEFFKLTYEMEEFIDESRKIDIGLEMYSEICDVIEQCGGVTHALEHMFGENFSSVASMEEEATAEKEAWYKRLWQWIKDFFAKLWAWFKSWFQTRDGMIEKLNELKDKVKAGKIKYPVLLPISINWMVKMGTDMEFMKSIKFESVSKWIDAWERALKEKFEAYFRNIAAEFASEPKRIPIEDDKTLIEFIDSVITALELSKDISKTYKEIEDDFKAYLDNVHGDDKASLRKWLGRKSFMIQVWYTNQQFFRVSIRCGNLILQRAKEA